MAMKKETSDPCKYVTWGFGALATLFMFVAMVLVFACGIKTFNLESHALTEGGDAPADGNSAVAGFPAIADLRFRCINHLAKVGDFNETASCTPGDGAGKGQCGMAKDGKIRMCLPSNRADAGEDDTDINPDDEEPRFGFLANGACGTSATCQSGQVKASTAPANGRSIMQCEAATEQKASTHGVCTFLGEDAKADGTECFDSFECKSNNCKLDASTDDARKYCTTEDIKEYTIPVVQDPCSGTVVVQNTKTAARLANHDTCVEEKNACPKESDGCYGGICRAHVQNTITDHNPLSGHVDPCFTYELYALSAPYLGLAFNLFIMMFLIPIHTFAPVWFAKRNSGWMIAACVGTMVSIYFVHHHYFEKTWDIVNSLNDCSGVDNLDAAYHMKTLFGNCVSYSGSFEFDDLEKFLGVTAYNNPVAMEFLACVAGFVGGIVLAIISIVITVFIQIGAPCTLPDDAVEA